VFKLSILSGSLKMVDATVLTLIDGVRVVVPDSLDLITPYVLREQLDFFEDELRFVRLLLRQGQKVVDIGANYGVYTLPMAKKVGATGHVWAFEPTSSTAGFLAQGIAANGFVQVTMEQKAVSSASGTARLVLQRHSELNSIAHDESPTTASETVSLVTLDECMDRYRWSEIELIKIDAEGEECNIVRGGRRFFTQLAPLVQYELRQGDQNVNYQLIDDFAKIAYASYRLVPGLNVLVPVHAESIRDPYLLNLFCCKASRADALADQGFLLQASDLSVAGDTLELQIPGGEQNVSHDWRHALAHLPYATQFLPEWDNAEASGNSTEVIRALSLYLRSRDPDESTINRYCALAASVSTLKAMCAREPTRLRLASLARVAHDFGERAVAVEALKLLLVHIREKGVDTGEPFLAPLERFDSLAPDPNPAHWLVAAVLEQLETRERFSSFYAGPSARERLEDIYALGLGSPEMTRRLDLVRRRFGGERVQGDAQ
jgi:FkbM family methyltransferase